MVMLVRAWPYNPPNIDLSPTIFPNVARSIVNHHGFTEMTERKNYHSRRRQQKGDKGVLNAPSWMINPWGFIPFRHWIFSGSIGSGFVSL